MPDTKPPKRPRPPRTPYNEALDLLARRPRSVRELRDQLLRRRAGEPDAPAQVDGAIERLLAARLLDDRTFAEQYARTKALVAGASRRRIRMELIRKGVASATADAALAEVFAAEEVNEDDLVERAARKKLRSLQSLDPIVRDRRLWSYLARRGYDCDAIRAAIAKLTGEEPELEG